MAVKKARSVRVSDQLWAAVKAKAAADEKSVSEVIVDALKAYIRELVEPAGCADRRHPCPGLRPSCLLLVPCCLLLWLLVALDRAAAPEGAARSHSSYLVACILGQPADRSNNAPDSGSV
jgi:hypothetical protein